MNDSFDVDRRSLLAALGASTVPLSGCSSSGGDRLGQYTAEVTPISDGQTGVVRLRLAPEKVSGYSADQLADAIDVGGSHSVTSVSKADDEFRIQIESSDQSDRSWVSIPEITLSQNGSSLSGPSSRVLVPDEGSMPFDPDALRGAIQDHNGYSDDDTAPLPSLEQVTDLNLDRALSNVSHERSAQEVAENYSRWPQNDPDWARSFESDSAVSSVFDKYEAVWGTREFDFEAFPSPSIVPSEQAVTPTHNYLDDGVVHMLRLLGYAKQGQLQYAMNRVQQPSEQIDDAYRAAVVFAGTVILNVGSEAAPGFASIGRVTNNFRTALAGVAADQVYAALNGSAQQMTDAAEQLLDISMGAISNMQIAPFGRNIEAGPAGSEVEGTGENNFYYPSLSYSRFLAARETDHVLPHLLFAGDQRDQHLDEALYRYDQYLDYQRCCLYAILGRMRELVISDELREIQDLFRNDVSNLNRGLVYLDNTSIPRQSPGEDFKIIGSSAKTAPLAENGVAFETTPQQSSPYFGYSLVPPADNGRVDAEGSVADLYNQFAGSGNYPADASMKSAKTIVSIIQMIDLALQATATQQYLLWGMEREILIQRHRTSGETETPTTTPTETATPTPEPCEIPPSQDFPRPHYDASNTGFNPAATTPETDSLPTVEEHPMEDITAQPVLADGYLVVPHDDRIQVYDGCTFEEVTELVVEDGIASPPVVHDGQMYVGTEGGQVHRKVVDGTRDKDESEGTLGEVECVVPVDDAVYTWSPNAPANNNGLAARLTTDLKIDERRPNGLTENLYDVFAISGDAVYMGFNTSVVRLDRETLNEDWSESVSFSNSSVGVFGETVLRPGDKTYLLDTATGAKEETLDIDAHTTACVTEKRAFVGLDAGIQALTLDPFDTDRVFETEQRVFARPVVADGTLFAVDASNSLYAWDVETSEPIWPDADLAAGELSEEYSPIVAGGRVFLPGKDGSMYVLG